MGLVVRVRRASANQGRRAPRYVARSVEAERATVKVLAGALLIVALAAFIAARYEGLKHDTGDRWLVGVVVSAACILVAVGLLRLDARRSG
jgi:hypothetical protein